MEKEADCGLSSTDLSKKLSQNMSLQKMSQHCALEDWTKFSAHLWKSAMLRNGIAYQLQPLVRHTKETGFGLLATPTTSQAYKKIRPLCPAEASGKHGKAIVGDIGDKYPEAIGSYLNPSVLEWAMGFPIGWTE